MGPPWSISLGIGGDFACGNDSLSAVRIQWRGKRKTGKGKSFPLIDQANLFYLHPRNSVLLFNTLNRKIFQGGDEGVTERYECNTFTAGGSILGVPTSIHPVR
jgi:hypothetical protein